MTSLLKRVKGYSFKLSFAIYSDSTLFFSLILKRLLLDFGRCVGKSRDMNGHHSSKFGGYCEICDKSGVG
jgi:hypothetical protein